jgi:hypothetical protein
MAWLSSPSEWMNLLDQGDSLSKEKEKKDNISMSSIWHLHESLHMVCTSNTINGQLGIFASIWHM